MILFASVLLERDEKVLLMRRSNTGYYDGKYIFPGGRVEEGETLREAASREVLEEVGIEADELTLVHVIHIKEDDEERVLGFIFKADTWKGEPRNMEPEKCDHVGWFEMEKIPKETAPYVRQSIHGLQNNQNYSELHWE